MILGLSAQTVTLLHCEGLRLAWVAEARAAALTLASAWSLLLLWQVCGRTAHGMRRALATLIGAAGLCSGLAPWLLLFWVW